MHLSPRNVEVGNMALSGSATPNVDSLLNCSSHRESRYLRLSSPSIKFGESYRRREDSQTSGGQRRRTRANSKSRKMEGMGKLGVTDLNFGIALETFPDRTKRRRLSLTNSTDN